MSPIVSLFLSLLAVAVTGFVIGWFSRRVGAIAEHNSTVAEAEARIESLTSKLRTSLSETSRVSEKLQKARAAVSAYEKSSKQSVQNTHETIGDLKRRDQKIAELETELQKLENERTRLQPDNPAVHQPVSVHNPKREPWPAVRTASTERRPVVAEEDVPVLKKRAMSAVTVPAAGFPANEVLPNITDGLLDTDEDVFDMTSEFDFDPAELLGEESDFDDITENLLPKDSRRS